MSMKLITNAGDYRSFKAFIAAKYAGVNIEYDEKEFVAGTTYVMFDPHSYSHLFNKYSYYIYA